MLKRIWQWLTGLFRRLFGGGNSSQSSLREATRTGVSSDSLRSKHELREVETPPPLSDSDYEYLFMQLLEGVGHGWQQDRVVRWFEALKGRTTQADWVAWLRRFGERVLASSAPNDELGRRLLNLGDQLLSTPSLQEIGEVAYDIGRQLLSRDSMSSLVWEYDGPDEQLIDALPPLPSTEAAEEQTVEDIQAVETITLDELFVRLQQDPNLLQVIAQQLGIETNDPQVIVEELINQFNASGQSAPE